MIGCMICPIAIHCNILYDPPEIDHGGKRYFRCLI